MVYFSQARDCVCRSRAVVGLSMQVYSIGLRCMHVCAMVSWIFTCRLRVLEWVVEWMDGWMKDEQHVDTWFVHPLIHANSFEGIVKRPIHYPTAFVFSVCKVWKSAAKAFATVEQQAPKLFCGVFILGTAHKVLTSGEFKSNKFKIED